MVHGWLRAGCAGTRGAGILPAGPFILLENEALHASRALIPKFGELFIHSRSAHWLRAGCPGIRGAGILPAAFFLLLEGETVSV